MTSAMLNHPTKRTDYRNLNKFMKRRWCTYILLTLALFGSLIFERIAVKIWSRETGWKNLLNRQ